jgi:O-antigen/teichoic acid export membrane protein
MIKHLRQLAFESLIYGLSGIISRFLGIFLVPIYTRLFTPEDYGIMSLVTTTMAVINIFVVLALDNSAARWYFDTEDLAERKSILASWAWCQVIVASVFALLIFGFSDWLGMVIVKRSDAGSYFRLAAGTLPLSVLGFVAVNWLRMQRRPWSTTFLTLGTTLTTIGLTLVFVVVLRWSIEGVFAAQLIGAAVGTLVAIILMKDWINPVYFRFHRLREMLRFGLPLIPAALAFWVVSSIDRYFLQFYASTTDVGLYQVGSSVAASIVLITGAFQQAWGPFAMSIHKQDHARKIYANVLMSYVCLTSIIGVTLALFSSEVIKIFATAAYLEASSVVGILSFSYIMIGVYYIASIGPSIVKTTAPTGIAITLAAGLDIILNLALVPHFGKIGSALSTFISQALVPAYIFYHAQRLYPIPYRFGAMTVVFMFSFAVMAAGRFIFFDNVWLGLGYKLALIGLFGPVFFVFRIITVSHARRLIHTLSWRLG